LLTGATPVAADYEPAIMHKILHVAPPSLRTTGVSRAAQLEPVIGRMLAKDPADRFASATEVIEALMGAGDGAPPRRRFNRGALFGGAVAALVVVGTLLVTRPWRDSSGPAGGRGDDRTAIAVLPFQNLSAEASHAYFAGGLHDELLTQLAKVSALKVISRTSVMGYAGGKTPLRQIASELGVGCVVEGSVQVLGERLRVSVQLVDAKTDEHLWAERYDRTLDDAFAIQSDVAQRIVAAVGATLGATEQELIAEAPTANAEAYQFYLQARDYANRPGYHREDFENAQQLYERALELDPGFALAHAGLSHVHGSMYWFRYDPSPARLDRQREEAEEALRLAPEVPQVHIAMGFMHAVRGDRRRAVAEYEVASHGLPNDAGVWFRIAAVQRRLGNWDQCFEAYEQAARLNPRDPDLHWDLGGLTFRTTRRYADSVRALDRALALAPDLYVAAVSKGWVFVEWQGQVDSLRAVLQRLPPDAPLGHLGSPRAQRAELLLWERRTDDLFALLASTPGRVLEGQGFYYPVALYAAWSHRLSGDDDAARAQFESALALLDSAAANLPDDERIHVARGLALAGLERSADAVKEADWLAQSPVYREDAYDGPFDAHKRARILAQAGAADAALDEIERLLPGPSLLTIHVLTLDPLWDPIREDPRFGELVARYGGRRL
jgi:serine/threonine-protein kinase